MLKSGRQGNEMVHEDKKTGYKRVYQFIILNLFVLFLTLQGQQVHVSKYGTILESDSQTIKNGILEKVAIYPQLQSGSSKRIMRKGHLVRYENADATILTCHGFMCDKYDVSFLRRIFPRQRYNIMNFDFRGHGEDTAGQCCTFGRDEALDVIAAVKFIKSHPATKDKPVLAYGFSMGAVSLIEAQAKDSSLFEAMILDCPFDSSENLLKKGLASIKFTLFGYQFSIPCKSILERYAFHPYIQALVKAILRTVAQLDPQNVSINICRFSPSESIKKVHIPCFFIHCKNDEKVPVDSIRSVFRGAQGYKQLWITHGRRHFDSFFYNPEKYTEKVRNFIKMVTNSEFKKSPKQAIIDDEDDGRWVAY